MENVFADSYKDHKGAREWLTTLLGQTEVEVTFTKKDGTERIMKCTLQEEYLPETVGTDKEKSGEALAVYDIENEGWRSFRWDSIKSVKFTLGD